MDQYDGGVCRTWKYNGSNNSGAGSNEVMMAPSPITGAAISYGEKIVVGHINSNANTFAVG